MLVALNIIFCFYIFYWKCIFAYCFVIRLNCILLKDIIRKNEFCQYFDEEFGGFRKALLTMLIKSVRFDFTASWSTLTCQHLLTLELSYCAIPTSFFVVFYIEKKIIFSILSYFLVDLLALSNALLQVTTNS